MTIKVGDVTVTADQVESLRDAVDQLLDDMGIAGTSVCLAAKAQARVALEPFLGLYDAREWLMPLEEARRIVKECDG